MDELAPTRDSSVVITVRRATARDAAALADVNIAAWQQAYRGILPDTYLNRMSIERDMAVERWRHSIHASDELSRTTYVAETDDGAVIGYVVFGTSRDTDVGGEVGEVWAIYVHPDEWRTGTGTALMDVAIEQLGSDGYTEAMLWVFERNRRARGFYERQGFRHDGSSAVFERGGGQAIELRYRRPLSTAANG